MNSQTYTVVIYPAEEGGFVADIPTLPGCMSQGDTEDEVLKNIQEAMSGYLECLVQLKQEIPAESSHPQLRKLEFNMQNNVPTVSFA